MHSLCIVIISITFYPIGKALQDASKTLRDKYVSNRFTIKEDDWPPYHPNHYTTLALIYHKGKHAETRVLSVTSQLATEGSHISAENSISWCDQTKIKCNTTKYIADLFTPKKSSDGSTFTPNVILIEGAPGMGKTVLSKEIAYQWASNKLLASKKLLFLLLLRDFNSSNIKSVENFFLYSFKYNHISEAVTKYVVENGDDDFAIVLDGYDELSKKDRNDSFIADVIYRQIFPKCLLVITSRPSASLHLRDYVDCRVEVIGFTEDDRLDYIKAAKPDSFEEIKLYLKSNPMINALCYIPLNMTTLLCLTENGVNNLPKTQTEMYKNFIAMTINRYLKKTRNEATAYITSQLELPQGYNVMFEELAHFAFEFLECDQLVFSLAEVQKRCPNLISTSGDWNGLGLLNSIKSFEFGESITCHFLHFSIQEYMAAYHISTLPDKMQFELLQNTFWTVRFYNTWIMYAGITGGTSFAMRHFLSGNWFKLSTMLLKATVISKNLLKDKIKCLHLFQCLVETQDDKLISLIGNLFQDGIIDLSKQTLLPRDLSILGFFLIRSLNKKWRKLNLSKCNIGNIECKILLDTLLRKDNRSIININCVELSYNHLSFSSLIELFDLFKSWNTTEITIADNAIPKRTSSCDLFTALVNAFICCDVKNDGIFLQTVSIGSFLFAYKIDDRCILLSTTATDCNSIYLLSCTSSSSGEVNVFTLLQKFTAVHIHILDTDINRPSIQALSFMLSTNRKFGSLYIFNSNMPDELADDIIHLILSKYNSTASTMLVVSKSKIQGIINTNALSRELCDLEILNLLVKIRSLRCKISAPSWSNDLKFRVERSEAIIQSFSDILSIMPSVNSHLKLKLIEQSTLVAHKVRFTDFAIPLSEQPLTAIYLSGCNLSYTEYQGLINVGLLSVLYILHCRMTIECMCSILLKSGCILQELFLHSNSTITTAEENMIDFMSLCKNNSFVLIAKYDLMVHNPTNKQLVLAHQLEPSINAWKFFECQISADTFCLIVQMLISTTKTWKSLGFISCSLGYLECEIIQDYFTVLQSLPTVKKINFSTASSIASNFVEIVLTWRIEGLIFSDENVCDTFEKTLREKILNYNNDQQFSFTVCCKRKKALYFYKVEWTVIATKIESTAVTMFLVNCQLSNLNEFEIDTIKRKLSKLSQLFIINSSLHEMLILFLLKSFLFKEFMLSIIDSIVINWETLFNFMNDKTSLRKAKVHFMAAIDNFFVGYNSTEYQIQLVKFNGYCFSDVEHKVTTMASNVKLKMGMKMFVFCDHQINALCFVTKQKIDALQIMSAVNDASFRKVFGNCKVTSEICFNTHNGGLEQLNLNNVFKSVNFLKTVLKALHSTLILKSLKISSKFNVDNVIDLVFPTLYNNQIKYLQIENSNLQEQYAMELAKSLVKSCELELLGLEYNNIAEDAAHDVAAAVLLCSTNLTALNLNRNNLQTGGIMKVAKSLQLNSLLTELHIGGNNITEKAADDIALVLSRNPNLTVLNLNGNNLQVAGIRKIARSLQNVFTLQYLGLENNNATTEAADDIASVLLNNPNLTVLNLNGNNLQVVGIRKIARSLQNVSTLQYLGLENNNATAEAADDIATVLLNNANLIELNLNDNNLQASGIIKVAKALQCNFSLAGLYIAGNCTSEEAANDIANILLCSSTLQMLNLNDNHLKAAGIIRISQGLQNVTTLQQLGLKNNDCTMAAANDIANVLSCNTKLTVLNLNGNNLQTEGITMIARSLLHNSSLVELHIGCNNITKEAADDIAAVLLHCVNLTVLNLNENNFRSTGIIRIAKGLKNVYSLQQLGLQKNNATKVAADDIAAILSQNTNLRVLNVNGNDLQAEGVIKVTEGLQDNSVLTELYIGYNNITEDAANDIAVMLSCNTNLHTLDLNGNQLKTAGIIRIMQGLQDTNTLQHLRLGNNNATKETADYIADVLSHNSNLRAINLNGSNLHTAGVLRIAMGLQNINNLQQLGLQNNNITIEATNDIAAILSRNSKLQVVNLHGNNLQEGIVELAEALQNHLSLTEFYIGNNNSSAEAEKQVTHILCFRCNLSVFGNHFRKITASPFKDRDGNFWLQPSMFDC